MATYNILHQLTDLIIHMSSMNLTGIIFGDTAIKFVK